VAKQVTRYECSCCLRLFRTLKECQDHEAERAAERAAYEANEKAARSEALELARGDKALRLLVQGGCNSAAEAHACELLGELPWTPDCSGWYGATVQAMIKEARQ
jgi:hypothetical protein